MIFLDANVFMYAVGAEGPHRQPCVRILDAAASGLVQAATNTEVVQEILYRYTHAGQRDLAVRRGREVCSLVAAVLPVDEEDVRRAMALMAQHAGLGVRDAIHAATVLRWECHPVVSADRGFDALEGDGLVRADPVAFARSLPPPGR